MVFQLFNEPLVISVDQADRSLDTEPLANEIPAEQAKEVNSRHRLWVSRGRKGFKKGKVISWRPVPRYRVAANKNAQGYGQPAESGHCERRLEVFSVFCRQPHIQ